MTQHEDISFTLADFFSLNGLVLAIKIVNSGRTQYFDRDSGTFEEFYKATLFTPSSEDEDSIFDACSINQILQTHLSTELEVFDSRSDIGTDIGIIEDDLLEEITAACIKPVIKHMIESIPGLTIPDYFKEQFK